MLFDILSQKLLPYLRKYHRVGIFVSGGLDSATLLYSTCRLIRDNDLDNEIVVFTVARSDDSLNHAKRIIAWINFSFGLNLSPTIVGDPSLPHNRQVNSGCKQAFRSRMADLFMTACTRNPPGETTGPFRGKAKAENFFQPFYEWTKRETVGLALELGLTEAMVLSHSCTEQAHGRCGKCWQCRERAWGFAENNISDPGIL